MLTGGHEVRSRNPAHGSRFVVFCGGPTMVNIAHIR